jgi:hypothetical protein
MEVGILLELLRLPMVIPSMPIGIAMLPFWTPWLMGDLDGP